MSYPQSGRYEIEYPGAFATLDVLATGSAILKVRTSATEMGGIEVTVYPTTLSGLITVFSRLEELFNSINKMAKED